MFEKILVAHDGSDGAQKITPIPDSSSLWRRGNSVSNTWTWTTFEKSSWNPPTATPERSSKCAGFASNPLYVSGTYVKFAPLRIDAAPLMRQDRAPPLTIKISPLT